MIQDHCQHGKSMKKLCNECTVLLNPENALELLNKSASLLRELEWAGFNKTMDTYACPWCDGFPPGVDPVYMKFHSGHTADCKLISLLAETEEHIIPYKVRD